MTSVIVRPASYPGRLRALRNQLNQKVAAFQARELDVDRSGAVFNYVLCVFAIAFLARLALIYMCAVPLIEHNVVASLIVCACMYGAAALASKLGWFEAMLLMRAGTLVTLAKPWLMSVCALGFYAGGKLPIVDPQLAHADALLRFDWLTYYRFADERPIVWAILYYAYASLYSFQMQAGCVILGLTRNYKHIYALLLAMIISLAIVTVIAAFLPALGPYLYFAADDKSLVHTSGVSKEVALTIHWLRSGIFNDGAVEISPLITFPSFHACAAVIFMLALWKTAYVRWFSLVLNLTMLAATPILGCHYLVDVIAGGLIGGAVFLACEWAVCRLSAKREASEDCIPQTFQAPPTDQATAPAAS